jgi:hypothetical protein
MAPKTRIFTPEALVKIGDMVEQGMNRREIASVLGCSVNSLTVRCSQLGISLRRGQASKMVPLRLSKSASFVMHLQATKLSRDVSMLAKELLEAIARDNLFDAVLDPEKEPA